MRPLRVARGNHTASRMFWAPFCVVGFTVLPMMAGCATHQVPLSSTVGTIQVQQRLSVKAALLITPETQRAVIRRHPSSLTSWIYVHDFPVGVALEHAALEAFSQVFQEVVVVRDADAAKRAYQIFIEPEVEDVRFSSGLFGEVHGKIRLRVTVGSGDTKLLDVSLQIRKSSRPQLFWNPHYDVTLGEVVSSAMAESLEEIAVSTASSSKLKAFLQTL